MPRRLIITIVCFHIAVALMVLFGILIVSVGALFGSFAGPIGHRAAYGPMPHIIRTVAHVALPLVAVVLVFVAVGIELVIMGLNRRRYWAWIVGLVISGTMILHGLHAFLVSTALGGLALWGLVDPETVTAFRPITGGSPPGR